MKKETDNRPVRLFAFNTEITDRTIEKELQGKTFLDPTYDPAFKRLFSDKAALLSFLNGVLHLEGDERIADLEYRNPNLFLSFPDLRTAQLDVCVVTENGKAFDIEMQRAKHDYIKDRMFLYASALALSAKEEADRQLTDLSDQERERVRYRMPGVISL